MQKELLDMQQIEITHISYITHVFVPGIELLGPFTQLYGDRAFVASQHSFPQRVNQIIKTFLCLPTNHFNITFDTTIIICI